MYEFCGRDERAPSRFDCRTNAFKQRISRISTIVFFFVLRQAQSLRAGKSIQADVQLLIYETEVEGDSPATNLVHQASALVGVTTTMVGQGQHFDGFGSKYAAVLPLLKKMEPDTLVVLSDARDVLINNPLSGGTAIATAAVQGFRDAFDAVTFLYPGAIVISAEAQCCVSALTYVQPGDYFDEAGKRKERACSSGESNCLWNGDDKALPWENFMKDVAERRMGYGASSIDDVYLNAGLITGKVADLLRVLEAADILASEDDQAVLTDFMYRHPEAIVLDYGQTMFGNNRGGLEDLKGTTESCMFKLPAPGKQQRLEHTKTQTTPLFVHSPGGFLQCHDDLAAQLGVKAIGTKARRRLQQWNTKKCNYKGVPCLADEKLVSGFCVKLWCTDDFQCPINSVRKDGRECYNDIDDCQCKTGYHREGERCVQDKVCYQCPAFSTVKAGCNCQNTMADCQCDSGFKNVSGYCVQNTCMSDFQCPVGRTRKPGRYCYDQLDDCQCV